MNYFSSNLRFLRERGQLDPAAFSRKIDLDIERLLAFEQDESEPELNELVFISQRLDLPTDLILKRNLRAQYELKSQSEIQLILLDVDGTLTDGSMYYSEHGDQIKRFEVKDGIAIRRVARRYSIEFGFISSGTAKGIIQKRAEALDISLVYAGSGVVKSDIVDTWLGERNLSYKQVAYIGDDLNDLSVIEKVGISACPANAVRQVKMEVDVVLSKSGGEGCVREFLEEVMGYGIE